MSFIVPLSSTPSQQVSFEIGSFSCRVQLRQLSTGLYLDLWMNEQRILSGCLCLDRVEMIQNPASPFPGTLMFIDQHGTQDPTFDGLESRFLLQFEGRTA
ncbi:MULTISPECIES: hypothetical protein [unclassified Saccharibacter]|uniref:phage baseplate plug family protein n=1 Tax=unclassified Saccharibacter TaxID=2648722 RepID=UPI0019264711|nr:MULTISPECIES: hypothetical protein [unclassified Saccharibacter]